MLNVSVQRWGQASSHSAMSLSALQIIVLFDELDFEN